jgi:2,4-dienoyl-CoA reductase-like NADH-dependent reductase (Old Yellow Enzyme family)
MSDVSRKHLLTPIKIGALNLKRRVVMPPMSRLRARWPDGVPTDLRRIRFLESVAGASLRTVVRLLRESSPCQL